MSFHRSIWRTAAPILLLTTGVRAADTVPAHVAPSVAGERITVAVQQLRAGKLACETGVFYIAPEHWKDSIKNGVVGLQAPRANAIVLERDGVAVWEFRKAEPDRKRVEVPDLTGLSVVEATKALAAVELVATTADVDSPPPVGKVVDHYPAAKQTVYVGTAVFIRRR